VLPAGSLWQRDRTYCAAGETMTGVGVRRGGLALRGSSRPMNRRGQCRTLLPSSRRRRLLNLQQQHSPRSRGSSALRCGRMTCAPMFYAVPRCCAHAPLGCRRDSTPARTGPGGSWSRARSSICAPRPPRRSGRIPAALPHRGFGDSQPLRGHLRAGGVGRAKAAGLGAQRLGIDAQLLLR
jgi:hypothetical protein